MQLEKRWWEENKHPWQRQGQSKRNLYRKRALGESKADEQQANMRMNMCSAGGRKVTDHLSQQLMPMPLQKKRRDTRRQVWMLSA